jgi:hypothetical protein
MLPSEYIQKPSFHLPSKTGLQISRPIIVITLLGLCTKIASNKILHKNASPSTAILSLAEVRVWGADALTQAVGAADVRWLVTDQLGTPRMVLGEAGSLAG